MKLGLSFLLILISIGSFGQISINEPLNKGEIVYVDQNEGDGILLERTTGVEIGSNGGAGGTFRKLKFKKSTSTVQLKRKDEMQFIFRFDQFKSGRTLRTLKLLKLRKEKKTREVLDNPSKKIAPQLITIQTAPYKENSLLVTVKGLEVGEYAFVTGEHKPLTNAYVNEKAGGKKPFWAFTVIE